MIWTTTLWTLPANHAIAYCLEMAYVVLEVLFFTDDSTGIGEYKILHQLPG